MVAVNDERPGGCVAPYDAMSSYWCRCHEMMGNDFYFLPSNICLGNKPEPMRGGYEFPNRPCVPTKPAVFDDSALVCPWTVGLVALAFIIVALCIVYDFLPKGYGL